MAVHNYKQSNLDENVIKKYEELKKHIRSTNKETQKLNDFWIVYEYLENMEKQIKEQQEQINKYRQFFGLLNSFLPKESPNIY